MSPSSNNKINNWKGTSVHRKKTPLLDKETLDNIMFIAPFVVVLGLIITGAILLFSMGSGTEQEKKAKMGSGIGIFVFLGVVGFIAMGFIKSGAV